MKKNFLWIAAAATVMASCAQFDTYREISQENDSAISFSTFSEKTTKAAENSNAEQTEGLALHHAGFSVWAWKYGNYGQNPPSWASVWGRDADNKATGTVSFSNTAWAASPLKFWDKSAQKYYFYAAAPNTYNWVLNNGTAEGADEDDYYLTLADFVLSGANAIATATTTYTESFKPESGTNEDLMIAENKLVERATTTYNTDDPAAVQLLFDHILSRLNITVKKSSNLNGKNVTVDITGFTITAGDLKNKGSFDESKASGNTLSSGTILRWKNTSPASPSLHETYTLGAGATINNLSTTATYIGKYLIIPQEISREVLDRAAPVLVGTSTNAQYAYFKIEYELNDEPYYAYYNLANAFGIAENGKLVFKEGWENTLNITIDADAIEFEPEVYKWAKDNVSGELTEVE